MEKDMIVIGSDNYEKHLFVIGKSAMTHNQIELNFVPNYDPTVEYLLRLLKLGFGWFEIERGKKEVENTKCISNEKGCCQNKEAIFGMHCSENQRSTCTLYKKRFSNKFMVNYVIIEKAGGIRGIR